MSSKIMDLPVEDIVPDQNQPRKTFDKAKLQELAESIKQHGLLQPILVCPIGNGKYRIVHGERRYRACKLLGLETIKAEIRELTDKQVLEIQLVENLQREDLNPIEEAETFERMIQELGYTHEGIAARIGKSREYVTNKLRLLKLPEDILDAIKERRITEGHARILLSIRNDEERHQVLDKILNDRLSVKQTANLIRQDNVSRETLNDDLTNDSLIVAVWISKEAYSRLSELASNRKVTVERLCSQIIEKEVSRND